MPGESQVREIWANVQCVPKQIIGNIVDSNHHGMVGLAVDFQGNLKIFLVSPAYKETDFQCISFREIMIFKKLLMNRMIQSGPDKYWIIQSYYIVLLYPRL